MISAVKLVKDQSYTLLLLRARSRYHKYHGALINGKQANKQTSKQTSKQANKQTSKQANKQTSKQANKQTSKQANKQTSKSFTAICV